MEHADLARTWKDILGRFLKLGATAYGGPATMGIMQAEIQERRQWVSKEHFIEGLSLVNLLPGATATQLAIFLGHARGGVGGGLLAGACFVIPGLIIMLALTMAYAALGVTPLMRDALYGLGPVVLGIYAVAVYRLGLTAAATPSQLLVAVVAAAALVLSPLGVATILLLAGALGVSLFHSRTIGAAALVTIVAAALLWRVLSPPIDPPAASAGTPEVAGLAEVATVLFKVGAFTFGGGLSMIALIQDQVVDQRHWMTAQEFVDGLALGQFTPGPILVVAAYVGYKAAGIAGALVGATAAFLPSFILMVVFLPLLDRVRKLAWIRAAMRGVGPAVIGVLGVSLVQLAPHALPDPFAVAILIATVAVLMIWRVGTLRAMLAGAGLGLLRGRLFPLQGVRAALQAALAAQN